MISDSIYDAALTYAIANATALHLCDELPTDRASALAASLGNKASPSLSIVDGTPDGRALRLAAFTDGTITTGGDATHYALISATELLVTKPVVTPQTVTAGNPWSVAAQNLARIADAT